MTLDYNVKNDIILSLVETRFSRRNFPEKIDVLETGPPREPFDINQRRNGKNQKSYQINFQSSWLENNKWLCTSVNTKALYCWPCLLFGQKELSIWNTKYGFTDFMNVTRGISRHEVSKDHIASSLQLKEFENDQSQIIDALREAKRMGNKKHNESVTLNRQILEVACRTTMLLSKLELPFRGHDEGINGNFKETFTVFMQFQTEEVKTQYLKNIKIFSCDSKTVQNDLIEVLTDILDREISNEMNLCEFFSIQMDETADICQMAQASIIIRYVYQGQVQERFLGFFDVSGDKTSTGIFDLLDSILKPLEYKSKLIGQCYDGASVMSGHLNGLEQKVKEICPQAVFIHSLAHHLNLVLQNSLKHICTCRIFFSILHGIPTFFHQLVLTTSCVNIPTVFQTRWTSNSKLITFVVEDWSKLKNTFESIRDSLDSDDSSRRQAMGFAHKFEEFEFTFLAIVFNEIFTLTDILDQILQSRSLEINYCLLEIGKTQELLQEKRQLNVFELLFEKASSLTDPVQKRGENEIDIKNKFRILYFEILDCICTDLFTRFEDLKKLKFISLIDTRKFHLYCIDFPKEELEMLFAEYGMIFKKRQRLKSELELLYTKETRSTTEMLLQLYHDKEVFEETYRLYCLIFTLPSTSVSGETSFSCLKRLKTYLRNSLFQERDRVTELAKISTGRELINKLIENGEDEFYKMMVDIYAKEKGHLQDLIYIE